jgi:hypothetical protein
MFSDFYGMKNCENANNSATAEARERIKTDFESLKLDKVFKYDFCKF